MRKNFDLFATFASSLMNESYWIGILKDKEIDVDEPLSSKHKAVVERLKIFSQVMQDKTFVIETFIKE